MNDLSVFGRTWGAPGVQGFFGKPHYNIPGWKANFRGITFAPKTATLHPREGHVKKNGGILEYLFPSYARVNFFSRHTLNAMGLPNPGIEALLKTGKWQQRTEPFFISIMAVENTLQKRLDELRQMTDVIGEYKNDFAALVVGIQLNRSCPNTGHNINVSEIVKESEQGLEILSALGWPLQEKFAIDTAPVEAVSKLQDNPYCDGICVSNTVKYNYLGLGKKIFGKEISPLAHLGGGGISGPKLLPLVCNYIKELRKAGFEKHINGGGGIFCKKDVEKYCQAGADSIFIGTVATHCPKRVIEITRHANTLNWRTP